MKNNIIEGFSQQTLHYTYRIFKYNILGEGTREFENAFNCFSHSDYRGTAHKIRLVLEFMIRKKTNNSRVMIGQVREGIESITQERVIDTYRVRPILNYMSKLGNQGSHYEIPIRYEEAIAVVESFVYFVVWWENNKIYNFNYNEYKGKIPNILKEYIHIIKYDDEGYDEEGFNKFGWDRNDNNKYTNSKLDKNGYDRYGYDIYGWSKEGIHKKTNSKFSPSGYDKEGYDVYNWSYQGKHKDTGTKFDRNGYDRDGYNKNGYNIDGWNREGWNRNNINRYTGNYFDKEGYDKKGWNDKGWNRNNINRETNSCYDREGYNRGGYDKEGYDREGYNEKHWNRLKMNRFTCDVYNKEGYDIEGWNREGWNINNINRYTGNYFDREGYDKKGWNDKGWNRKNINKETNTILNKNGYDRFGYDKNGFDEYNFNREKIHKLTKTKYDKSGFDREGYNCEGKKMNLLDRGIRESRKIINNFWGKLKTELTMKEYIRTNIIIFILWLTIFIWGLMVIGSEGSTGDIYGIYLIISLLTIVILKIRLNYKFNKSKIGVFLLIPLWILSIYLGSIINSTEYIIITPIFLQTFINLIFIKEVRKKCIKIFTVFTIAIILLVIINSVINSESLSFILNTILIIVLVLVLFYQKMLEYKYVRLITEGTDIEYKITNRELFIYGIFINNILIAIILFKLALNELDGEYLIIVFALLILLITKFIKKYVKNKITNQTKKFSKFEILLFAIFAFLMILKVVPYGLKSFIIPIIYIYLDIKLPKITWGKIILKIKDSKLKPVKTAIFDMGVLIFLGIIVIVGTIMYIPMRIVPILILIEKIKEFKEIKEVDEEDIY